MSANKYALGTIVGTAVLGLVSKVGNRNNPKIGIGKKLVSTIMNTLYLTTDQVEAYLQASHQHPNLFNQIEMNIKEYLVNQDNSNDDIIVEVEFEEVDPDENIYNMCIYLKTVKFYDPSQIALMDRVLRIHERAYSEKKLDEALPKIPLEQFFEFDFSDDAIDIDSFFMDQIFISKNGEEWSIYKPKNTRTNLRRR